MTRREKIEAMLADSPDDVFLRYALAMELENDEEHEKSLELHNGLIQGDPPYVPSFFMSGKQLSAINRTDEAIEILKAGISEAQKQNDAHAAREMQEFLDMIQ